MYARAPTSVHGCAPRCRAAAQPRVLPPPADPAAALPLPPGHGLPLQFRPAGGTPPGAAPPLATAGLEVAYTGLRLADSEGVQWALLYFNDSKSFWLAPFDSLGHCDSEQPGEGLSQERGSARCGLSLGRRAARWGPQPL